MKKAYFKPEIEITGFTTEDIITASSVDAGGMNKNDTIVNVSDLTGADLGANDNWN